MKFKDYCEYESNSAEAVFCEMVDKLTKEWNESDGNTTCEFSTGNFNLHSKNAYLFFVSKSLKYSGTWRMLLCDTCYGHNKDKMYHVEIIKD